MLFTRKRIVSLSRLTLRLSGSRHLVEYEMAVEGDLARFTRYDLRFDAERETRLPRESATRPAAEVVALLNRWGVLRWDGFHGRHPRSVRDGTMFRLDAIVNGDRAIHADGSQRFPRHFFELEDYIETTLRAAPGAANAN